MPRGSLPTAPGSGPPIETFVLGSGIHVPFSLLRGMKDDGTIIDIEADDNGHLRVDLKRESGTWAYLAGVSGTSAVPVGGRVLSVGALGGAGAGSVTINGGASIPIPAGTPWSLEPKGNLVSPTFVFTGTQSFTVEYVSG